MEFVKQVIAAITEEFRVLGKTTAMSVEQALSKAEGIYLDADGELDEDVDFFCDHEAMESIYETVYTLMTEKDYKSDAARIVENIKNDEALAEMRKGFATHGRSAWMSAPENQAQVNFIYEFANTYRQWK